MRETINMRSIVSESMKDLRAEDAKKKGKKSKGKKKGKKAKSRVKAQAETLSDKDRAEALVAQQGMAFTRGRVYSTPAIVEAQVRVLKTGRPEVVPTSGVGHIAAVLLYRETSGDCVIQNLKKPA